MLKNRKIVYLVGFLFSIPIALASYVNSSFLSSFVGEKFVGLIYALGSICAILALLIAPSILRKIGGYKFIFIAILLDTLTFLMLSFTHSPWVAAAMFILGFSLNTLVFFALDELLEIFGAEKNVGKTRGSYLTFVNLAWIVAQVFSYSVIGNLNFSFRYFASFMIMFLVSVIVLLFMRNVPDANYDKLPAIESVKKFFKNKNLLRSYKINFILQFFFVWMIIYTPIYLYTHLGFSLKETSVMFAFMLLPFVLIEFPLGKYSDKIGERKMLMLGFLIASIATISLFFIKAHSVWVWAMLLFCTRIGAAIIEIMSDAYFFKHITKENDEFIGIYRNTSSTSYILAPLLAFLILSLIPSFNFIFLILGAVLLYGVYVASTIRKSDI